jgi:O-antigen/teichoic acid export membrane protein
VANTSPEPFSNWFLSVGEDIFVVSLGFIALKYPLAAAVVVLVGVLLMIVFAAWIVRAVKRRWRQRSALSPSPTV